MVLSKAQTEFALPVISKKGSVLRELNIDDKFDEEYIVMRNLKHLCDYIFGNIMREKKM